MISPDRSAVVHRVDAGVVVATADVVAGGAEGGVPVVGGGVMVPLAPSVPSPLQPARAARLSATRPAHQVVRMVRVTLVLPRSAAGSVRTVAHVGTLGCRRPCRLG